VISSVKNLIRKKYTYIVGWGGVIFSRGLNPFVTLESDFHPPMAPNQVIESVQDDCLYSQLENEFDPQEQDQLQIQTGSGVTLTVYKNIQSSQKDKKVVLAKSPEKPFFPGANAFPVNPPASRPGRRANSGPRINPPGYRVAPKIVDQGVGAAANPAGAGNGGGAAEFDDNKPSSKKEQSQESKTFDYRSNDPQKKKKSKDQCPMDQPEVNESFNSNSSLKKVTKQALGNQDVKREYTSILKRIGEGVDPMDIGGSSTDLGDGLTYVRGRHGRYIIKNDNGVKDIVGIAYRGSRNDMKTLAKEMNKSYNVNIEPGGY